MKTVLKIGMAYGAGFVLAGCATLTEEDRIAREAAEQEVLSQEYAALAEGEAGEEAGDGRICRVSGVTGTRLRNTRTCLTAAEWRHRANQADYAHARLLQGSTGYTRDDDGVRPDLGPGN